LLVAVAFVFASSLLFVWQNNISSSAASKCVL